ncbi:periplasmic nitrate reductase, NapE protein [Pseudomonas aeruginosa]|uniref:periplasmic nitrate reductase, NapE protein n=1 Tax=Pseudomonas aeruginosa TaxID=287 RepID=UPI00223C7734|nr:periplasmic nitrate reductase, NapE protein [Pseudomonas aeruginosa]
MHRGWANDEQPDQGRVKGMEARLFLFLVICLFPLLSVALVGGFGFCVWMYQLLAGPPGPPA